MSLIDTNTGDVVQTVNVNPLPGSTVGSYPNAIIMPDSSHILVSIGRDNALAVYGYSGAHQPRPVRGPAADRLVPGQRRLRRGDRQARRHQRQGHRRPRPGRARSTRARAPARRPGTTPTTTPGRSPSSRCRARPRSARYTHQVFVNNALGPAARQPPAEQLQLRAGSRSRAQLGCPSTIKHVFLIVRENRTYDQVFGDVKKGNGDPAVAQFGAKVTPNAHALASAYGLFDNFYDQGTLSADGHNWLVQADANDYIEKEFGAFYRSYPAQGGDALAYQRDGFIWNAAEAAGKSVKSFAEYNNFISRAGRHHLVGVLPDLADPRGQGDRPATPCRRRRSTATPTSRRSTRSTTTPTRRSTCTSRTSTGPTSGCSRSRRASRPATWPT